VEHVVLMSSCTPLSPQLMNSDYDLPVNIGNPDEYTMKQFAQLIHELVGGNSSIVHLPATK
jgi:UDP-glucuronate decarboxylase